ncbi:hypothetical protein CEXT_333721 [Caerostris extrusa]|uniref:Uncharacterized protein n=1 Tax=Caerostris extrusa TaxID=172846 RepID=A0AAV4XXV8_CAEEX|nr:hypothetical protein CEXT_333721 [Caerostris extrusa]
MASSFHSRLTKPRRTSPNIPNYVGIKRGSFSGCRKHCSPGHGHSGGEMCPDCFSRQGRIVGGNGLDQRWNAPFFLCTPSPQDDRLPLFIISLII